MSHSPREIVQAALRFDRPERLPVRMGCFGCDDTAWVHVRMPYHTEGGADVDEWGCA